MNHLIIVKFKPEYTKKQISEMLINIKELFNNAKTIPGIEDIVFQENCVDRPNRYDILIKMVMNKEALLLWDSSEWHYKWKNDYGHTIEKKCIFDYE